MNIVKPTLILTVGLGLGFANPLALAQNTANHGSDVNPATVTGTTTKQDDKNTKHQATSQAMIACIDQTVLPRQQKIYGIIEPTNQHWPRPLMGSHQPSPEALEVARSTCEGKTKKYKHQSH